MYFCRKIDKSRQVGNGRFPMETASICMICLMHNSLANQLAAQSTPFAVTPIAPRFAGASQNFAKKARMGKAVSKNFARVCVNVETASQSVVTEYISPSVSRFIIFPACCCVVLADIPTSTASKKLFSIFIKMYKKNNFSFSRNSKLNYGGC